MGQRIHQGLHRTATYPLTLRPGKQIDMAMRRIAVQIDRGQGRGLMNGESRPIAAAPLPVVRAGVGQVVPQPGQPIISHEGCKSNGIRRAQNISANPDVVCHDKGKIGFGDLIGQGKDQAEQSRVILGFGGVLPSISGFQADHA